MAAEDWEMTPRKRNRRRIALAVGALCAAATAFAGGSYGSANSYWYCWDQGDKAPHHLGHPVDGDHVCSDDELKGTGFNPA